MNMLMFKMIFNIIFYLLLICSLLQLREKYPIQTNYDLDEEALYFTEKSYEDYLAVEDIY